MSELSKNTVLKYLSNIYNERTYDVNNYTEDGKSLSIEDLHRKTNLNLDVLNSILKSLSYNDYIKPISLHGHTSTFYLITEKGFDALVDKRFVWYAISLDKVLKIIPIIISSLALWVALRK